MEPPGLHDALLRHGLLLAESLVLGKVCPQKTQPGLVQRVPRDQCYKTILTQLTALKIKAKF